MKYLLMKILSPGHFTSDMGQAQGTTVRYKKRKMSWIRGWFHDKILAELLKNSSH